MAIQAFADIRPDLVRLLLRAGAAAAAAGRSIATQMDLIWAQNPERTMTRRRLAAFEDCVIYVVANGHAPDIIVNSPQLMVPLARSILNESAGRGLVRLFDACMNEVDQSGQLVGWLLDQYDVTVQRIFDQPQPRPQALPIIQRLYQSLSFLEARYDLNDRNTLGHLRGLRPDRHPSTARAAILFGALSQAEPANQVTNWLLNLAPLGRDRCASLGNMHPFTYLFHPRNGKRWDRRVTRAGYERDLDMLINSGLMAVQSPIDSNPSPIARAEGTQPLRMGEDAVAVLYWQNSLRNWSTPLSYALNHWLVVESPNQVPRERSAGLHAAFYLLSRGANPRQVDLAVQIGMANEWNLRQAQNNVDPGVNVRPLALPAAARGMTSLDVCTGPGEAIMNYTNNDWRRVIVPLYFVSHRANVLPVAGNIMFI
ncbi:hypothetical protein PG999_014021 [Apiospora kogelbergensis]|uniref:Uncharacterized protein n=1 Tax=Apiospora kogelbergensis TaxID=1337665 RepID=A0AAW0QBR1_9PEZI